MRITVSISENLNQKLRRYAKAHRMSMSQLIAQCFMAKVVAKTPVSILDETEILGPLEDMNDEELAAFHGDTK